MEYVKGYTLERILEAIAAIALDLVDAGRSSSALYCSTCMRAPRHHLPRPQTGQHRHGSGGEPPASSISASHGCFEPDTVNFARPGGRRATLQSSSWARTTCRAVIDIYAFGATLYRMLTHIDPDARLRLLDPRLDLSLPHPPCAPSWSMMALKAEERPAGIDEVRDVLTQALAPEMEARPESRARTAETRRVPPKAPPSSCPQCGCHARHGPRRAWLILDMQAASSAVSPASPAVGASSPTTSRCGITNYRDGEMCLVHPWRANLGNRYEGPRVQRADPWWFRWCRRNP